MPELRNPRPKIWPGKFRRVEEPEFDPNSPTSPGYAERHHETRVKVEGGFTIVHVGCKAK